MACAVGRRPGPVRHRAINTIGRRGLMWRMTRERLRYERRAMRRAGIRVFRLPRGAGLNRDGVGCTEGCTRSVDMTTWDLVKALTAKGSDEALVSVKGCTGILEAVERESGSGKSFNLTIRRNDGQRAVVHVLLED